MTTKICANEYNRIYRQSHHESLRARHRDYYQKNRERIIKTARNWQKANPERVKAILHRRQAKAARDQISFTAEEWVALCERFDWRCAACGERKPLTPDHVIPAVAGGPSTIDNIQPLCLECNASKGAKIIDFRGSWRS